MTHYPLLKNQINRQTLEPFAQRFATCWDDFDQVAFLDAFDRQLSTDHALMQRVELITTLLRRFLPTSFDEAAHLIEQAAGPAMPQLYDLDEIETNQYGGFIIFALADYFSKYGLHAPQRSLAALKHLTSRFSSELAIRPFILKYPELSLETFRLWQFDPNVHVRRLVSESLRPRLPWGIQLKPFITDPTPLFPFLEELKNSPERYVQRSVANHINDISKDHPERVLHLLKTWQLDPRPEIKWMTRHALRSLVKQGHPQALTLCGYPPSADLKLVKASISPKKLDIGQNLQLSLVIKNTGSKSINLRLDYQLDLLRKSGQHHSKTFHLKKQRLQPGEALNLQKGISFQPRSTRAYYPGRQYLYLLINGQKYSVADFLLQR